MQFKAQPHERFMKEIHERVNQYLKSKKFGSFANYRYWFKIGSILLFLVAMYALILNTNTAPKLYLYYCVYGIALLILTLNLAHDAAHNSITKSHNFNAWLFYATFMLNGVNPYLWRKRHIYEHHPFPNIPHRDPDLIQVKYLRFSKQQAYAWYHSVQWIYAPFLYAFYGLFWVFIKDFKKDVSPFNNYTYTKTIFINIGIKLFYFGYMLILPIYVYPTNWKIILIAFLIMQAVQSLFLVFTFVISHYIDGLNNSHIDHETIHTSWEMHQINSSVDFHGNSKIALFIFGGFNCHNAHHLFPTVAHVHYPYITKVIQEVLKAKNIPINQVSFIKGIDLHFKLLLKNGKP